MYKVQVYCTVQSRSCLVEWDGEIVSYSKELLFCPLESQSLLKPRQGGNWCLTRGWRGKDSGKLKWAGPKCPCCMFPWYSEL